MLKKIKPIEKAINTRFGKYIPISSSLPNQGQEIRYNENLSDVCYLDAYHLDEIALEKLAKQGFVIVPNQIRDFKRYYNENAFRISRSPVFLSTDFILHNNHLLLSKVIQHLEINYLIKDLTQLVTSLYDWACREYQKTNDSILRRAYRKLASFFAVPLKLMQADLSLKEFAVDEVTEEIRLINDTTKSKSPITENIINYSQFIVRGHYQQYQQLSAYFQAVIYLKIQSFYLAPRPEISDASGIEHTRQACLLVKKIVSNTQLLDLWNKIDTIMTFIAGSSNCLNLIDYKEIIDKYSVADISQPAVINDIIKRLLNFEKYRLIQLPDDLKGFHLLSQPVVIDNAIFLALSHPQVFDRTMVSGLDVLASFGSLRALNHLETTVKTYPRYLDTLKTINTFFASRSTESWVESIYSLWVYSLIPLLEEKNQQYPSYMRTKVWKDKELTAFLGSWAELRHDTILYSYLDYVILCIGEVSQPHIIEPNVEVYARIEAFLNYFSQGLRQFSISIPELKEFQSLVHRIKEIAEIQTKGRPTSRENNDFIESIGETLQSLLYNFQIAEGVEKRDAGDAGSSIIVDVYEDVGNGQVLEVGTGDVFTIYVIVNDINGKPYLTKGGVYSYYEFPWSSNNRLTNSQWRKVVKADTIQATSSPIRPVPISLKK
ncbi:MAG: DUF3160 domain-containing protein [Candidatus Hodarchaeota archaeon]